MGLERRVRAFSAVVTLLLSLGFLPLAAAPAAAEKRVALVIGNGKYRHASTLPNPSNDARAVAKALGELGFEVLQGIDLDHSGMQGRLRDFLNKANSAQVALLFYAGHGLQVDGRNYLVPVDAKLESASDLNFGTVDLDRILASLDDPKRANIVILDACRDNPLARSFAAKTRSGAVGTGLAAYTSLGTGTLIAFATAPGKVAADGDGTNSPFTAHLLKHLRTPGLEVRQMLTRVRNDVALATGERQIPWDNSSLRGDVYLASRAIAVEPVGGAATSGPEVTALQERLKALEEQLRAQSAKPKDEPKVAVGAFPDPSAPSGQYRPGATFKDCDVCPEMVVVPAGSFTMGSPAGEQGRDSDEGPQHGVTIRRPFAVGKFAVTFEEWDACVADGGCNGYRPSDEGWGRGRRPVIHVNWHDAQAYVAWLSRRTGKPYRLLSEAEREYVTRAGTTTPFWWGSSISTSQANYDGNYTYGSSPKGEYRRRTVPVDWFQPNPWGLYQVHGNVWEWTEDCWNDSYRGAPTDGSAWMAGNCGRRVLRGGSWNYNPWYLRSAARNFRLGPTDRNLSFGFRVARTLLTP